MNRRRFVQSTAWSVLAATAGRPLLWAQPAGFRELRRGVGIFESRGGTIGWLINPDAVVLVDSQFPDTARQCANGVQERSKRRWDAVFNTHHHGDHVGGNGVFAQLTDRIIAHRRVPMLMQRAAAARPNDPPPTPPTETFETEFKLDAGDETIHARYYGPAHTSGDSVIYFERANVVHMGDLVFNRSLPFIDRDAGASIAGWAKIAERVADEYPPDAIYIFGHGNSRFGVVGGRADLLVERDFLNALLETVQKDRQAGKSKEGCMNRERVPGFPDHEPLGSWLTTARVLETAWLEVTEGVVEVR